MSIFQAIGETLQTAIDTLLNAADSAVDVISENPGKAAAIALGTVAAGGAALAAAPLVGAAASAMGLGAAAGTLSGAAASSAGLAALGGGSLAAGGAGVAGGTAVVTAAGAVVGGGISGTACAVAKRTSGSHES
jgi:hypothetical protein